MDIQKIKIHFKSYWHIWILAFVVLAAFAIRIWKFDDFLLFRADQARDAYDAKRAFERGISHLRMLGPKVDMAYIEGDINSRGDTLHIGPFYYYLQYFFTLIFRGVQPWVIALPDMLMFVFSIPLFYYFCIQFFDRKISLLVSTLYSFSFFNLLYSRLGWNPNQLFFWTILLVLGLYKLSSLKDEDKDKDKRNWWLLASILIFLIISQLHFVALSGFFLFLVGYLILFRPKIVNKKFILASLAITFIFFLPIVASDLKNNGDNAKRFLVAINKKQGDPDTLIKRASKTYDKFGEFFIFGTTSFHEREIKSIEKFGGVFFITSLILAVILFYKSKSLPVAKNQRKLMLLLILWSLSFFLIFSKISDKLSNERYFIPISPLLFLFLGIWFSLFDKIKKGRLNFVLLFPLFLFLLAANLNAASLWYNAMETGGMPKDSNRNLKLGPYDELITYGRMKDAFDYMVEEAEKENKKICLRSSNYQYNLGFEYIRDVNYPKMELINYNDKNNYLDCKYYVAGESSKGEREVPKIFLSKFEIINSRSFGALTIWNIELKQEIKDKLDLEKASVSEKEKPKKRKRAETWLELLQQPPYYE
jgi:4-amino-4-deoxy-L-arabinose transferase-like glycosyltransferase